MKYIKDSIKLMAEAAVGGAIIGAIAGSGMPQGTKDVTQTMVGVGLVGSAYKKFGGKKTKWL